MRYPNFLDDNGNIGFVAPSFGASIEPYKSAFNAALDKFKDNGFTTNLGMNCYKGDGIGISTKPSDCAKEFMECYMDDDMDILISCGGGELMCEILDYIDFDILKNAKPKWFSGYSDNTNLTFLLTTICDVASIYGPCAATFGMNPWHQSIKDYFEMLQGKKLTVENYDKWEIESKKDADHPFEPYNTTENFQLVSNTNKDETFSGRLIGGCLDCLSNIRGTRFDKVKEFAEKYKEDGIIWYIESCELNVFDIRRSLWALKNSGWFKYTKGFLIGRPMVYDEPMMGLDRHTAVTGVLDELNVPIIMDLDIGHTAPMMPLINGTYATVNVKDNNISIQMELFE